ncbi:MAG: ROK family protein [Aromatoleum sp.]|jgi:fructokinase|uniref:ROK family protein n=1 Tax=Aromatoleum sp. TaxID=2307007 RepID=UPI002894DEAA|nr:ROK family protein [Aromatoleum sp.]MDT3671529.1 ROK family protein [Aromatoleum sp.]
MRIGIDLGGTKIEIVVLDRHGDERLRRRVPTPQGDYAATVETVAALVEAAEREIGARASVGIGTPGSPSPRDGRIRNANSTCLNGRLLQHDLAVRLEREMRIANDANCLAVSEAADGAGAGARTVFGVILGTGVGGGIVVRGELLVGANAIAGEWGHMPLPLAEGEDLPFPRCYCGRRGCIETYLSGPGLAADHQRRTGRAMTPAEIASAARQGNAECDATLARYEDRLARALAAVMNILDPDVIVLGGGLSRLDRLYRNVPDLWRAHVFSDSVVTRLVPSAHGDSSGVRGAAWLWPAT